MTFLLLSDFMILTIRAMVLLLYYRRSRTRPMRRSSVSKSSRTDNLSVNEMPFWPLFCISFAGIKDRHELSRRSAVLRV